MGVYQLCEEYGLWKQKWVKDTNRFFPFSFSESEFCKRAASITNCTYIAARYPLFPPKNTSLDPDAPKVRDLNIAERNAERPREVLGKRKGVDEQQYYFVDSDNNAWMDDMWSQFGGGSVVGGASEAGDLV